MIWGGWRRRRSDASCRGSCTRRSSSPARRSSSRSTSRAARSSTPRSASRRRRTSSRSKASALLVGCDRAAGDPTGTRGRATRLVLLDGRRLRVASAVLFVPVVQAGWRGRGDTARRARDPARPRSACPPLTASCRSTPAGMKYATGRPGVVSPDDPIDTIARGRRGLRHPLARPRADGGVRGAQAGPRPATAAGVDRRRRRSPSRPRTAGRRPSPSTRSAPTAGDDRLRVAVAEATPMTRREALADRARRSSPSRSSCGPSSPPRSSSRSPRTRPTTSASRGTCVEGRGLVSDALWSYQTPPLVFPRPAFEVWLPLPTLPRRDPDGALRHDVPGGAGGRRSSSARSCRSSPGGSPRTSRWNAGCRQAAPGRSPSAPA